MTPEEEHLADLREVPADWHLMEPGKTVAVILPDGWLGYMRIELTISPDGRSLLLEPPAGNPFRIVPGNHGRLTIMPDMQ